MFVCFTTGCSYQKKGQPTRIPPYWGWEPQSLLLSFSSLFTCRPCFGPPSFPIPTSSSFPRLWCPWGLAEAPIKPAVNGSNPVINGCVLQTRVWGCCSHGFIRWNGIGTHTHRCAHSFTNEIEAECVRISIPTHTRPHMLIYTASDWITSPIVQLLWMPCRSSATITFKWLEMQLWCIMMMGWYGAVWAVALFMPSGKDCN